MGKVSDPLAALPATLLFGSADAVCINRRTAMVVPIAFQYLGNHIHPSIPEIKFAAAGAARIAAHCRSAASVLHAPGGDATPLAAGFRRTRAQELVGPIELLVPRGIPAKCTQNIHTLCTESVDKSRSA
jgi:hypothetical protein